MKKDWKELEGHSVRIDVGSTTQQALSDDMPAEVICFTSDNKIVFNGEIFANPEDYNAILNRLTLLEEELTELKHKLILVQ